MKRLIYFLRPPLFKTKDMEDYKKKYKEALERAREQYNKRTHLYDIESIFSELQESEDERIRLEIRNFIWEYPDKLPERDKWIAWFEKQKGDKNEND